jgi:tetratricopeptide (TPR) repeat protein
MDTGRPAVARALIGAAGVLLACALFFGGGSGHESVWWLGLGVVGVLAAWLVFGFAGRVPLPRLGWPEVALLAAVGGFVAWQGLSVLWSIAPDRSWDAFDKGLVLVGFLGLGLAVGSAVRSTAAAGLLAALLGAVLVWALAGKAIPAFFEDGERVARLRNPVGYWNGLALLADFALPLGLWLGVRTGARVWIRVGGALVVYGAVAVILLTVSRTGVAAGAFAVALWLVLSERRVEGALVALVGTVPAAALAAFAFARPALVDDGQAHSDRVRDGAVFGVLAVLGAVLVAGLVVWGLRRGLERRDEVQRRLVMGAIAAGAVAVVALVLAVGNPVAWAADQFSESGSTTNDPGRLLEAGSNNRWQWWQEAWDVWRADPILGAGANTFELARRRYRENALSVSEPHSTPLQALSDGGVVGLLFLVAAVVAGVVVAVAALRRLAGAERAAAAALVVLPAAWVVHGLADYDLDFLATTAPALFALGVVGAAGRSARVVRRPFWAVAVVALAVGVAASLAAPPLAEREVRLATRALEDGDPARAVRHADRARSLDPFALEPLFVLAGAEARRGDPAAALAALRRAVRHQPENARTWEELGLYEFELGDLCSAYRNLNEAYTRDRNGSQWRPDGPLDQAREHVNAGRCS